MGEHVIDRLVARADATRSHLAVGLDPDLSVLPPELLDGVSDLAGAAAAVERFCAAVIEGVAGIVPAVKPQSAFFEQLGSAGMAALEGTIARARAAGLIVVEDAKRGDIGSTMAAYARASLGRIEVGGHALAVHDADLVTVSPYLGPESLAPMVATARELGKGLFVLVRTTNPGAGELQELPAGDDGAPLHRHVAALVDRLGADGVGARGYCDVGAVVGLTVPEAAPALRAALPRAYLLVPGLGAQGGRTEDLAGYVDDAGLGALVAAARSVLGGWRDEPGGGDADARVRAGARAGAVAANREIERGLVAGDRWRW